jgi:phospholipid/cholesterol/gamma-HCH transport system ATP-binding protein
MVLHGSHFRYVPLCDLAEGLIEPHDGRVEFLGEDWQRMANLRQSVMRGKIGRVFENQGWVSNLTVYDNVALSQRHHTLRSEREIAQDVEWLARKAGTFPLPEQLPESIPLTDLRRAEWVRAFLGGPKLVLLERPEHGMTEENLSRLMDMVLTATEAGAAVVWMTTSRECWQDRRLTTAGRFSIEEGAWLSHFGGENDR